MEYGIAVADNMFPCFWPLKSALVGPFHITGLSEVYLCAVRAHISVMCGVHPNPVILQIVPILMHLNMVSR